MSVGEKVEPYLNVLREALVEGEIRNIKLSDLFRGNDYLILLFYPMDFTFVCPTEICAFSDTMDQFKDLKTQIAGISVDSVYSHYNWSKQSRKDGGIGKINFPLVSDMNRSLCKSFNVLSEDSIAYRGMFIIDKSRQVRIAHINDLPIGRSVNEALRLIRALQFNKKNGEVCPANWRPGKKGIKADVKGAKEYFKEL